VLHVRPFHCSLVLTSILVISLGLAATRLFCALPVHTAQYEIRLPTHVRSSCPAQPSPIEQSAYVLFVGSLGGVCMHAGDGGAIGAYMPVPQFDPCTTAGAHFNLNSRADTTELRRRSPNPNKATLKPSKPPAYSVTASAISAYGRNSPSKLSTYSPTSIHVAECVSSFLSLVVGSASR